MFEYVIAICGFWLASPAMQLLFWCILFYYISLVKITTTILIIMLCPVLTHRNYITKNIFDYLSMYFLAQRIKSMTIYNYENYQNLDGQPCILAATPHGIMPLTPYLLFSKNDNVVIHAASIIFYNPITRFFLCFLRGCMAHADKKSIEATLNNKRHVLLYPGGVQEALISNQTNCIYTKHKGFIKIAKNKNVPVIPIFIRNENKLLTDCIPSLTKWCYKTFKIPIPTLWFGLPNHIHVYFGKPLYPENYESIEQMHENFYKQIEKLNHS
tara:strand:- start:4253 stop:5062 length:810 start_codon:yes stop_codon:yes gene_type:complete